MAWELESAAIELGWPTGRLVGSERSLTERFGVSRETLRQAVRIVEQRGSMKMIRGRSGGLGVASPGLEETAAALATYLAALGFGKKQCARSRRALAPILSRMSDDAMVRLCSATIAILNGAGPFTDLLEVAPGGRGAAITRRLIDHAASRVGDEAKRLGSEWQLACAFDASRPIIRQALRVLADLDMLVVKRGRGGGFFVKRPSHVAIVRRIHPYMAAQRLVPDVLTGLVWELNIAHLGLAARHLEVVDAGQRIRLCDGLAEMLYGADEPERWVRLQQRLAILADSPLIDTLLRCIVSYQMRGVGRPPPAPPGFDSALLAFELQVVEALRAGDRAAAETSHRAAQDMMSVFIEDRGRRS